MNNVCDIFQLPQKLRDKNLGVNKKETTSKMHRLRVHVTSSNYEARNPEFTGRLYRARDNPEKEELTFTSQELQNLDVTGGPICIEHDYKLGKVGYIKASKYQHPWLYITGVIDSKDEKIREEVRKGLRSGRLSELSIGFHGMLQPDGTYSDKVFDEASLVKEGFYEGTKIVAVCASKNTGEKAQVTILRDAKDICELLKECIETSKVDEEESLVKQKNGVGNNVGNGSSNYINNGEKLLSTLKEGSDTLEIFVKATKSNTETKPSIETVETTEEFQEPVPMDTEISNTGSAPESTQDTGSIPMDTAEEAGNVSQNSTNERENIEAVPEKTTEYKFINDLDDIDTSKMTPQQVDNVYRQKIQTMEKQLAERLETEKKEKDEILAHAAQLEEFKRQKDEEWRESKKADAEIIKKEAETLMDAKEKEVIQSMIDKIASDRDHEVFLNFMTKMTKNSVAKDEALRNHKKEMAAIKRRETRNTVSVQSSRNKRVREASQRRNDSVRPVSGNFFDLTRSPMNMGRNSNSNSNNKVSVQSSATDPNEKGTIERFGNQHVVTEDEDRFIDESEDVQENPLAGEYRRIVYAQCTRKTAEKLIERGNSHATFFSHSLSQASPELFLELVKLRSGADVKMPMFGGKDWGGKFQNIDLTKLNPQYAGNRNVY